MSVERSILVSGREVAYVLKRRRGYGRITLKVTQRGVVTVTTGLSAPQCIIDRFLESRRTWLAQALTALPMRAPGAAQAERAHYEKHKEAARTVVHAELVRVLGHYGLACGRVSIRNTSTRWGSCSSRKNLNFSYRVLFLPPTLREYIVVHEVCHLKEMNHSPAFWALVARMVPDYRLRRKAVRAQHLL